MNRRKKWDAVVTEKDRKTKRRGTVVAVILKGAMTGKTVVTTD